MNYRHIYHAGSFADVLKHVIIIHILNSLSKKDAPILYMDTHAGIGLYPLDSIQANKTGEHQQGVGQLLDCAKTISADAIPPAIGAYIRMLDHLNPDGHYALYPGSPLVAAQHLRAQDSLILSELHKDDIHTLKHRFKGQGNVAVHHMDGYLAMKAFLPPKSGRGLVHIDPAFESNDEYIQIEKAVALALERWRNGCFMIWYPIKETPIVARFEQKMARLGAPHATIHFQLTQCADDNKMQACGVMLINPPWQVPQSLMAHELPFLANALGAQWTMDCVGCE